MSDGENNKHFSYSAGGTREFINGQLLSALYENGYVEKKPVIGWKWGFVWGCLFMAALNIGDVHVCVGECDGSGVNLLEVTR